MLSSAIFSMTIAKEVIVSSAAQITTALSTIAAGDTITMVSGTWTDQKIVIKATGTSANPILLRAQSNQSVLLTGTSTLRIAGSYLVVDGLKFEGGYSSSGAVIEFQGTDGKASNYCRLTNTSIKNYNPSSIATDYKWVSLFGQYNRVDHCAFENKTHMGTTLVVWLSSSNIPNYHQIDHNYFGPRPILLDINGDPVNGGETIRVGTSDYSMNDSYTTVEYNYFDRCNGEIEVISSKSCKNIYRYNVFVSCQGMLTLRHGNRCSVYGNYFFCNKAANSGGIRIIGEDHAVYNNYIEKSDGTSMKTGITIVNGVPNSPLNRYFQVKRAQVVFNTLVGNRSSIHIGAGKDSELSLPPLDCTIANNLVWSTSSPIITYSDTPINMKYEGNIFFGATLGISLPQNNKFADPGLIFGIDSMWRLNGSSIAKDSADGNYPFVTVDMDGQPRNAPYDVGSDEYSSAEILNRPVRKSDVGPFAKTTSVSKDKKEIVTPEAFGILGNYPNPFNPSTNIEFSIHQRAHVKLIVYNGIGEQVRIIFEGNAEANKKYTFRFDASGLSSGLYYAELLSLNQNTIIHKMLFLK